MTKRVIIVGASGGIGHQTALELSQKGAELVLAARRKSVLERVASECRERGATVLTVPCDIAVAEERQHLVLQAMQMGSGVEPVLVNSSGVAEFGDYATMGPGSVEHQIQSNLLGPMLMCQDVLPWMLHLGKGQIVNVLSIAAEVPFSGGAAYGAAKAGMLHFGRALAAEYRGKGIRITSLLPGSTDTPLWEGKEWVPPREDMLSSHAVAEIIRDLIRMPSDRTIDHLVLMPPKGVL